MSGNEPGKYDDLCTLVRVASEADAVVVIIVNGIMGNGFSIQLTSEELVQNIPAMLEKMAKDIRADLQKRAQKKH